MFDFFGLENGLLLDPGTSLLGAKKYLADNGFSQHLGDPPTLDQFDTFSSQQTVHNQYAGKSMSLGAGGRAALLKHKLIVSGKYGNTLEDVSQTDWQNINTISRINYFNKRAAGTL